MDIPSDVSKMKQRCGEIIRDWITGQSSESLLDASTVTLSLQCEMPQEVRQTRPTLLELRVPSSAQHGMARSVSSQGTRGW